MSAIDDLIARLEKAEGPDRQLDADITRAVYLATMDRYAGERVESWWLHEDGESFGCNTANGWRHERIVRVPRYTASIDAALTLVPESCDVRRFVDDPSGTGWTLSQFRGGVVLTRGVGVTADLPALALCIAALKARKTESAA